MKTFNKKTTFTHKFGDGIERVGEFIQKLGATKLGTRVYNYGNKIEHMNDVVNRKGFRK